MLKALDLMVERSKGVRGLHAGNGVMEVGVVSQSHIIFLDSKQTPGVIKEEF